MAYTSHGHHIPGTPLGVAPNEVANCGGPGVCDSCNQETVLATMMKEAPVRNLGVSSVIRQSILFGRMAARAVKLGDSSNLADVEKEFEEFLKLFPGVMYGTQMPEYRYQVAVEAYTAAYLKEATTSIAQNGW